MQLFGYSYKDVNDPNQDYVSHALVRSRTEVMVNMAKQAERLREHYDKEDGVTVSYCPAGKDIKLLNSDGVTIEQLTVEEYSVE